MKLAQETENKTRASIVHEPEAPSMSKDFTISWKWSRVFDTSTVHLLEVISAHGPVI